MCVCMLHACACVHMRIIFLSAKSIWKDDANMAGNLHAIVYCIEEALLRAEEQQFVVVVDFAGLAVRSFGERFDRVVFDILATKCGQGFRG